MVTFSARSSARRPRRDSDRCDGAGRTQSARLVEDGDGDIGHEGALGTHVTRPTEDETALRLASATSAQRPV
jgi:hypothetical protein